MSQPVATLKPMAPAISGPKPTALAFTRIAIVIDYDCDQNLNALSQRLAGGHDAIDVFVASGRKATGVQPGQRLIAGDPAKCVDRNLRKQGYAYALFVRHPRVGAAEIDDALARLRNSEAAVHYLIPGVNELLTAGFIALIAYDMTKPISVFPRQPLAAKLRRRLAPHLPVPVKQALKDGLEALGLLARLGLAPMADSSQDSKAPVRIATHRSVAWVTEHEGAAGAPYVYSLGSRDLQKQFFVDEVERYFPQPKSVSWVLSNQCNLKCVMCPYHSPLFVDQRRTDYFDAKRWMPLKLVARLADEFKGNTLPITFHIGELDEPLMHPEIVEIVRLLAAVPHATVHITSNGNLVSENMARGLIAAGLKSVQFSVDAYTPETYKRIRGAKLEKVQRNVERFLRMRDELNPDLYVNLCIIEQREAAAEIGDFKAYWRARGASSVSVYKLMEPKGDDPAAWLFKDKYFKEKERTPCSAAWDQCFVYPEGEVSLCCTTLTRVPQDGIISVGNLNRQTLREIWLSRAYQDVRDNLIFERFEHQKYCADCDVWSQTYQYRRQLDDGTSQVYGEGMAYYFFPKTDRQ